MLLNDVKASFYPLDGAANVWAVPIRQQQQCLSPTCGGQRFRFPVQEGLAGPSPLAVCVAPAVTLLSVLVAPLRLGRVDEVRDVIRSVRAVAPPLSFHSGKYSRKPGFPELF